MFGVNWWPVKNTRLSFDWVWNGFNNPIPFTGGNPLSSFNTLWFRYAMFFRGRNAMAGSGSISAADSAELRRLADFAQIGFSSLVRSPSAAAGSGNGGVAS